MACRWMLRRGSTVSATGQRRFQASRLYDPSLPGGSRVSAAPRWTPAWYRWSWAPFVLFLLLGAVFGVGLFTLETGTGQGLAANHVQKCPDASIKLVCSLHVVSNRRNLVWAARRTPLSTR